MLLEEIRSEEKDIPPFQLIKEEKEYTSNFQIPREKGTACFDADKLNEEIYHRKWQIGDTFIPFGMKGNKRLPDRPQIFYQSERASMGALLRRTHCMADRRTNR